MSKITCTGPCGEDKDASEFYGTSKKCKACTLARQKELKLARANGTTAPKERKSGGGSARKKTGRSAKPAADRAADSAWSRPAGMGFSVQLEVDENTKQTDIRIDQWNASAEATQSVWLNQSEASELHSWLTEKLGL